MTTQKKKKSSAENVVMQRPQVDQEVVQEAPKGERRRSFHNPLAIGPELAALYEEHKKRLAGVFGPYVPRTTREEDEAMFARMGKLGKRDRRNPERNFDLMPEKQVVAEELPKGDDEGTTFVL
jgi:hypothetical protein